MEGSILQARPLCCACHVTCCFRLLPPCLLCREGLCAPSVSQTLSHFSCIRLSFYQSDRKGGQDTTAARASCSCYLVQPGHRSGQSQLSLLSAVAVVLCWGRTPTRACWRHLCIRGHYHFLFCSPPGSHLYMFVLSVKPSSTHPLLRFLQSGVHGAVCSCGPGAYEDGMTAPISWRGAGSWLSVGLLTPPS